jgi:hypothetical protein
VDVTVGLGLGVAVCVGAAVGVRVGVGDGARVVGGGVVGAGVVGFGVVVAGADRVGGVSEGRAGREADVSGTDDLVGVGADDVGSTALGRADEPGPPPPPQAVRARPRNPAMRATRSRLATCPAYNPPSLDVLQLPRLADMIPPPRGRRRDAAQILRDPAGRRHRVHPGTPERACFWGFRHGCTTVHSH